MYLSDVDIRRAIESGDLKLESTDQQGHPFDPETQIRIASVDLRIGNQFMRYRADVEQVTVGDDLESLVERLPEVPAGQPVKLSPGEVLFAPTLERIILSNSLAGRVVARSSLARLGISATCSCDFINPGQHGIVTLQLVNHNSFPVYIVPFMSISQLVVVALTSPASKGYTERVDEDSRYPYETQSFTSRIALDAEVQRILQETQVEAADPAVRAAIANVVEIQRLQQMNAVTSFLKRHMRGSQESDRLLGVLQEYSDSSSGAGRELTRIRGIATGLGFATLAWLINNASGFLGHRLQQEDLYIPATAFVLCLVFGVAAGRAKS